MTSIDTFDHPLIRRYASPEMQRLFSPRHRYTTWRRAWLALAEAERELGLEIPEQALEEMRHNLEVTDDDLERVREYEPHATTSWLICTLSPTARPPPNRSCTSAPPRRSSPTTPT
jgi:hypothetical protein